MTALCFVMKEPEKPSSNHEEIVKNLVFLEGVWYKPKGQ